MPVATVQDLSTGLAGISLAEQQQVAKQKVAGLGQLATLPTVTLQIMRLADDPHATGDSLDRLLMADPTLGARVLRVVNSAFYGLPGTVTTTGAAIVRLGFAAIRNIAIAASLTRMFRGGRITLTFDAKDVWRHSVAVAEAARLLARRSKRGSADEALLAGLLHDIGIVVAMQGCRPEFERMLTALEFDDEAVFADAEREHLGTTHALLGAELSRRWGFPATLASVAEHHHAPMVLDVSVRTLPALVHVADHLAVRAGEGYTRTVSGETLDPAVVAWLGLKDADLDELLTLLPSATDAAMQVLGDSN
jgi:putative nucleotidyltransferase with HDIG domain